MRVTGLSLLLAAIASAQSSPDVVDFLQSTAAALASAHDSNGQGKPDAGPFLAKFDPEMAGFEDLRENIESLVVAGDVGTAIEVVSDEGDDDKRDLQLDWVLEIVDQKPRRKVVKCTIERVKGVWRITALDPIDFFKG